MSTASSRWKDERSDWNDGWIGQERNADTELGDAKTGPLLARSNQQIVQRDRYAELVCLFAIVAAP